MFIITSFLLGYFYLFLLLLNDVLKNEYMSSLIKDSQIACLCFRIQSLLIPFKLMVYNILSLQYECQLRNYTINTTFKSSKFPHIRIIFWKYYNNFDKICLDLHWLGFILIIYNVHSVWLINKKRTSIYFYHKNVFDVLN